MGALGSAGRQPAVAGNIRRRSSHLRVIKSNDESRGAAETGRLSVCGPRNHSARNATIGSTRSWPRSSSCASTRMKTLDVPYGMRAGPRSDSIFPNVGGASVPDGVGRARLCRAGTSCIIGLMESRPTSCESQATKAPPTLKSYFCGGSAACQSRTTFQAPVASVCQI